MMGHIKYSPIMLGIPVNISTAKLITKSLGEDAYSINRYLGTLETDIRIQILEGSHEKYVLGYNITNVSRINGALKNVTANVPADNGLDAEEDEKEYIAEAMAPYKTGLLHEISDKVARFQRDIRRLNPELSQITLSLHESSHPTIIVNINDLEPYLFSISM